MKEETDVLYVKNVIEPLERLIQKIQISNEYSHEEVEKLDKLLLEKYLILENILQENSSNSQEFLDGKQ